NPGDLTGTIVVLVNGDTTVEADEMFLVNLDGAVNATIAGGTGTGTIVNDDAPAGVTLSIDDLARSEGDAGTTAFVFTVRLSAASSTPVTVAFSTANNTAKFNGKNQDFLKTSGTITFAPGETSNFITVLVNGDTALESDETFFVNLAGAAGATIADGQ